MKLFLTAFEPFGGEQINAALEAVNHVSVPSEIELSTLTIPTVFGAGAEMILSFARSFRPDAIIMIGQASGRPSISLERIAINLRDASMPDNVGNQPVDQPVVPSGPAAYFSTLPLKTMRAAVLSAGIPCDLSCSAGTFVCNDLMYSVLHLLAAASSPVLAGFIHVPCTPEQASLSNWKIPSMQTSDAVKGLEAAILSLCRFLDGTNSS